MISLKSISKSKKLVLVALISLSNLFTVACGPARLDSVKTPIPYDLCKNPDKILSKKIILKRKQILICTDTDSPSQSAIDPSQSKNPSQNCASSSNRNPSQNNPSQNNPSQNNSERTQCSYVDSGSVMFGSIDAKEAKEICSISIQTVARMDQETPSLFLVRIGGYVVSDSREFSENVQNRKFESFLDEKDKANLNESLAKQEKVMMELSTFSQSIDQAPLDIESVILINYIGK